MPLEGIEVWKKNPRHDHPSWSPRLFRRSLAGRVVVAALMVMYWCTPFYKQENPTQEQRGAGTKTQRHTGPPINVWPCWSSYLSLWIGHQPSTKAGETAFLCVANKKKHLHRPALQTWNLDEGWGRILHLFMLAKSAWPQKSCDFSVVFSAGGWLCSGWTTWTEWHGWQFAGLLPLWTFSQCET